MAFNNNYPANIGQTELCYTCKSCDCIELGAVTMSSESWLFTNKYYQVPDADKNLLGQGGSSVAVER